MGRVPILFPACELLKLNRDTSARLSLVNILNATPGWDQAKGCRDVKHFFLPGIRNTMIEDG